MMTIITARRLVALITMAVVASPLAVSSVVLSVLLSDLLSPELLG